MHVICVQAAEEAERQRKEAEEDAERKASGSGSR